MIPFEKVIQRNRSSPASVLNFAKAFVTCDVEVVQMHLSLGANPNVLFHEGYTPLTLLMVTATSGKWKTIAKLLIEAGASPNVKDPRGMPIIYFFIMEGAVELVSLLIDKGADIEAKGPSGETPLLTAVHYRQLECLHLLLRKGANCNVVTPDGNNALMWAASRSNGIGYPRSLSIIKTLIQYGANVNYSNPKGYTPLMASALIREVEAVKVLLKSGSDPELKDCKGETALVKAVDGNEEGVVKALIAWGADANTRNSSKCSPLMYASSPSIALILLNNLADPNSQNEEGLSALHFNARENRVEIAQLLVEYGASIDLKNTKFETSLQEAVRSRSFQTASYLLDCGAAANNSNSLGVSVLHDAILPYNYYCTTDIFTYLNTPLLMNEYVYYTTYCTEYSIPLIKLLLSMGADVNLADCNGVTPLMLSAATGSATLCKYLIDCGADSHICDSKGRHALFYAAKWGQLAIVKLLQQNNCWTTLEDDQKNLPIYFAAQYKHEETVMFLMLDFAFYMHYLKQDFTS